MRLVSPILSGVGVAARLVRSVLPVRVLDVSRPTNRNPLATATIQFGRNRFVLAQVGVSVVKLDPRYPNTSGFWSGNKFIIVSDVARRYNNAFWNNGAMVFGDGDSPINTMGKATYPQHEGIPDRYPDGRL